MSKDEIDLKGLVSDYGDVAAEVHACRSSAALFDFSFISRARLTGPNALKVLNEFQSRNLDTLLVNQIYYALRTSTSGAVISDLTIWRVDEQIYEMMSGSRRDIIDLGLCADNRAEFVDLSDSTSIFTVQGPESLRALEHWVKRDDLAKLNYYQSDLYEIAGVSCRIGRLGYTGERGFELILPSEHAPNLWSCISRRVPPAGFCAIDILRIEAGFILFTNECICGFGARELGLSVFASTRTHVDYQLICFTADSQLTPLMWQRNDPAVKPLPGDITVTSACYSELTQSVLGLGFVCANDDMSTSFNDPTGQFDSITRVNRPVYDTDKRKPRGLW